MMRRLMACALVALAAEVSLAGAVAVERGNCSIVVAPKALDVTKFAAEELQEMLGEVLGERPPIVKAPAEKGTSIILGENEWSRAAGLDAASLERDAFVIRAEEPARIYICGRDDAADNLRGRLQRDQPGGNGQHATVFGVYEFLERFAGCRFFFPGEFGTVLPKAERIEVPAGDVAVKPYFTARSTYPGGDGKWYEEKSRKALSWLRLRLQTYNVPCCHGQNQFMPVERFAKDHPEYFQQRKDGTRCTNLIEGAQFDHYLMKQLCHSSKVWDEFYLDATSYLRGEKADVRGVPSRWFKGKCGWNANCFDRRYVDMMPQDGMQACFCDACQKAYRKGEKHYATDLIWENTARFANRLKADGFTNAVVTQMAYTPYEDLPKVDVPDNVLVILAQGGPWSRSNPEKRAAQIAKFKAWREKTGRKVRMWTYPHKYGPTRIEDVPCMAPRAWGEYYQLAAPYTIGGFCESESDKSIYQYLNYYVFAKVAWNPDLDLDALLADHHRKMFGKGAAAMAKFYEGMEQVWIYRIAGNIVDTPLGPVARVPDAYAVWTEVYSPALLKEWRGYVDEALRAAEGDADATKRIRFIAREFLEPLATRAKTYLDAISPATGLKARAGRPNRSILVNGEFESLDGWKTVGPGAKAELDGCVKLCGKTSLKLVSTGRAMSHQDLTGKLKPDTTYRVSFFLRLKDVEPVGKGNAGVYAEFWDGDWRFFPRNSPPCGTRDWTYQEYVFTTGKKMPDHPYFHFLISGAKGTAWFDDVRVEEVVASDGDDTARLQALLDAGKGRVEFPDGTFVVSKPLVISSDTHLVCSPRTVVRLAAGANCPILRNCGSEPGGSDRNITVEGGVWDGNNVHQKRGKYRLPKTPGGGDINQLTVFAGITNLTLRGMTLKDPDCYCIELTDIWGFTVEDIVFDCNDKTPNQDGLHIDGYARDGYIRNIRGHTNDDLVALNSDEGNWRSPSNDIVNVTIDGLYAGDDGYTAVRLLSRNAHIRNVVIRNVYGKYKYNGVSFTHWAFEDHKPGMGHFDNIVIENMFVSCCTKRPGFDWCGTLLFQGGVESVGRVTVRNLRRVDDPDCRNDIPTVNIGKGVKIDTLIFDNVKQQLPDGKPLVVRSPEAEIRNFIVRDGDGA